MDDNHFTLFKESNGYWYYYAYRYGIRYKKSTKKKKKSDALAVVIKRLENGDILNEVKPAKPKTFEEFASGFWNYDTCPIIQDKIQRGGHYSVGSAQNYMTYTDKEFIPYFGKKFLIEITNSMIREWHRNFPKRKKVKPKTANEYLIVLRMMFAEAVRQNLIPTNPCAEIKPLICEPARRGCYTQAQIDLLFSQPFDNIIVELMCKLAASTGMRIGEVQCLSREQVHDDYILVDRSYNAEEGVKTTKSGKSRIVPIPKELHDAILALPTNGEFIFSLCGRVPIHRRTVEKSMHDQFKKVGLENPKSSPLLFHSFRHYFNTKLVASGVDASKIRSVIGHESEEMTEHYLHLTSGDLDSIRAVQKCVLSK